MDEESSGNRLSKLDFIKALRADEREYLGEVTQPFPKRGHQRPYTDEEKRNILTEVFSRMAEGESLQHICMDEHMPSPGSVKTWIELDAEWQRGYDSLSKPRARALFELALFEVQRARCRESMFVAEKRANVYLRAAALLDPSTYSDKTHSALAKNPSSQPIAITLNIGTGTQEQTRELVVVPTHDDTHE